VSAANVASGATAANAATSANTPSTIVARDASGNFSAGTITANLTGNATTATTATTAANFSGTVADSQLSANVALLNGTNNFTATNQFAGVVIATNVNNQVTGSFTGDGSGLVNLAPANLSAGTAAINITGNAATATSAGTATSATTATTAGSATTAGTANNFSGSLAGDVTGTQGATVVSTVGLVSAANVASGANAANAATSANTPSTIVARDASGNFSAGTITANLTGNATTATTATTAANFSGTVADSQLSANVALLNGTNNFTATNQFAGVVIATNVNNQMTGSFTGDGSGLLNVYDTNTVISAGSLVADISATNYTVQLLPGASGNLLTIITANTNVNIILTGTNNPNWQRSVLLEGWTNTAPSIVTFAQAIRPYGATFTVFTNTSIMLNFYNVDTTGTNVLVTSGGVF
jgi:hypothetical protein